MTPENLAEVLPLYEKHLEITNPAKKAKEIFGQTQTAIYRYTLPGWGCPSPQSRKPTHLESATTQKFAETISVAKLKDAAAIQEEVFQTLNVSTQQRYTYGSKLENFLAWVKQQDWWIGNSQSKVKNCNPSSQHGYGNGTSKRTTNRTQLPSYSLKPCLAPTSLKNEIEEFKTFLTKIRCQGRKFDALKPSTAEQHVRRLYFIFGWFLQSRDVEVEALTLNSLVPKLSSEALKNSEQKQVELERTAVYVDDLICELLDFFEITRKAKSSQGMSIYLHTIQALIRFQYQDETRDSSYSNIPAMVKSRQHVSSLQKRTVNELPVANITLKWLELPDIFKKIVSPLRSECQYRTKRGVLRSDTTIAYSFQLFLIWGCLTFRPPRRQQEYRDLKIAMSCPITKPKNMVAGQFVHPLPTDRTDDDNIYHGYLFKHIDGFWYMDMMPTSYKTGKAYGHQKLLIPNQSFSNGKCFYDYLEAFLYGYYRDYKGNWTTDVDSLEVKNGKGKWHSLRMAFNPEHNHFFVTPRTGEVYTQSAFSAMIKTTAHRLTGQLVTPHLLRDIYATWFLNQEYSEAKINSLAHAMAHSSQMLRKVYDRRSPEQKNRSIEETMAGIVEEFVD